jgi:hypothetical protein
MPAALRKAFFGSSVFSVTKVIENENFRVIPALIVFSIQSDIVKDGSGKVKLLRISRRRDA